MDRIVMLGIPLAIEIEKRTLIEKIEDCRNWEEIFDFQSRKDGANYSLLKEWLIKNYEVPKLKS